MKFIKTEIRVIFRLLLIVNKGNKYFFMYEDL